MNKEDLSFVFVICLFSYILFLPVSCINHENNLIAEMVKNGTPANEARCAIKGCQQ